MRKLSSFDRKLCAGLFVLLLAFIILLSLSFAGRANQVLTISLNNSSFTPNELIVPPGQKVTWVNNSNSTNAIVSDNSFWQAKEIQAGDSFSVLFSTPGMFFYHVKDQQGIIKVAG